jgi:hypothetical protein
LTDVQRVPSVIGDCRNKRPAENADDDSHPSLRNQPVS